jgi:hypothetical protein
VTPTGREAKLLFNAAALLYDNAEFRIWTGAVDAAAAKAFIWFAEDDDVALSQDVAALIHPGPVTHAHESTGSSHEFATELTVQFRFLAYVPSADLGDHGQAWANYLNSLSATIDAMLTLSGDDDTHLALATLSRPDMPMRSAYQERDGGEDPDSPASGEVFDAVYVGTVRHDP